MVAYLCTVGSRALVIRSRVHLASGSLALSGEFVDRERDNFNARVLKEPALNLIEGRCTLAACFTPPHPGLILFLGLLLPGVSLRFTPGWGYFVASPLGECHSLCLLSLPARADPGTSEP
jgi:hypothetical protein